jgi:hypothetical protein
MLHFPKASELHAWLIDWSEEIEVLFTFLSILLLLLNMEPHDGKSNRNQTYSAHHHNQVKTGSGWDEKFESPFEWITSVHEDNQLWVGDDRSPHVLSAFALNTSCSIECLHIIVWSTDTQEGERQLQRHVAGLESLGTHSNQLVVLHVRDHESVGSPCSVVIVHVVWFLELRVDRHSLDEEVVRDYVVVEDADLGVARNLFLQDKVKLAIVVQIDETHKWRFRASGFDHGG